MCVVLFVSMTPMTPMVWYLQNCSSIYVSCECVKPGKNSDIHTYCILYIYIKFKPFINETVSRHLSVKLYICNSGVSPSDRAAFCDLPITRGWFLFWRNWCRITSESTISIFSMLISNLQWFEQKNHNTNACTARIYLLTSKICKKKKTTVPMVLI